MEDEITAQIFEPSNNRPYIYIEFFRNGEAWSKGNKTIHNQFLFGIEKAKIVIECWDLIEEYVNTDGTLPTAGDVKYFSISGTNWGGYIRVVKVPKILRDGQFIEKHYLDFIYGKSSWGFGLTKAKAILQFREKIQELADRE